MYKDFPKLEAKRLKLMKTLEEKSYEGDSRIYPMEEVRSNNYGEVKPDENGLYPEELLDLTK